MEEKKVYVVEKEGNSHICVKLTENEATALVHFLDWACLDEDFTVTPAEDYKYEEWGEKK